MANTIAYADVLQKELDSAAAVELTSGWMEPNSAYVKYTGGKEVKIADIAMDGLADYDRASGFVDGDITLTFKTYEMTQDRGRRFSIDEADVDESGFLLTMATAMGEFQRQQVIPEIDSYRYSKIASLCEGSNLAGYGYTPAADTILGKLTDDIAAVQEIVGENVPLVISMSMSAKKILDQSKDIEKHVDVTDFKQGDVTLKVKILDGNIIKPVPTARMKTKYVFNDGTTSGQEAGGFKAADDAQSINWIITPRTAPIAVSKIDKMRIFDPETNQKARAWSADYRRYHDLWIPANKLKTCFVNIMEVKSE